MIPLERGLGAEVGRSDSPNKELRGSGRLLAGGDQSRPYGTQGCKILNGDGQGPQDTQESGTLDETPERSIMGI